MRHPDKRGSIRSLRVGFLHLAPALGALEYNQALLERATVIAAQSGAQWVLSGELVVPGYRFAPVIGTEWISSQPAGWLMRLAELTASLDIVSFVSHPERDGATGRLFNSLFVLGQNGSVLGRHRKLMPTPISEAWSSVGGPCGPVLVDGVKVGLLICADAVRSDVAVTLRNQGAQLLISAAAWWPGQWGPSGEWEARTKETGLPMLVCNRTGVDGESDLTGSESVVVDAGREIVSLKAQESAVFVVDCKFADGHVVTGEVCRYGL